MIAVDTNVILRLVLDDDDAQVAAARALMLRAPLFVSLSVLLETGWVLQSRYRFPRAEVADALQLVVNLNGVIVARLPIVLWAIGRYREGADLADMIHLASAAKIGAFATFDRGIEAKSGTGAPIEIETLT
ncbi:hypothetical protein ASG11_06590 [Sphingomonas sp. Leaf357]|uniref:type II toxin-antitoxin system VapC family toxin n=1 Tax=Sphingomonas sp. Leaf357 TaxID=1736350 RepID=UPI0006FD9546|nr:type II toxin-antitoxin system VapC family toxin [Sphingomonas sp. Leaf357]KQS03957.1 hypothetical protein ASG11_06590 [Sphingomonas sp. Leaf357]